MRDYESQYRKVVGPKFIKGQQNNHILYFAERGKEYSLEEYECLSIVKDMWIGEFTKSDERSFRNAWRKCPEPSWHYGEKKKDNKSNEEPEIKLIKSFQNYIEMTKVNEMSFEERDTSILKWWFKENDLIHIVEKELDKCEMAYDVKNLIDDEWPLKRYQYMSVGTFKDMDGKRRNVNVKENRLLLLECDKLPLDTQKKFFFSLIEYGLPVKSITYSGGKSYHCLLKIHPMKNAEEYKKYCEDVFKELNKLGKGADLVDTADKDAIRYTRVPFRI